MDFLISAGTDVGTVKKVNQDCLYAGVFSVGDARMAFAILCDGMGGLQKGEVASASVVQAYKDWAAERLPALYAQGLTEERVRRDWCDLAVGCNESILSYGKERELELGTTITALLVTEQRYYVLNIGDSRAYEITDECKLLTRDQTVVAREVELGLLTQEEAQNDRRRNVLLQCIGATETVYPDVICGETKKDAVYMLCSDGFRHEVSQDEIGAAFHPSGMTERVQMRQKEQKLIELNKQRGERDNISVITIRTMGEGYA